jgi:hypothetical protein
MPAFIQAIFKRAFVPLARRGFSVLRLRPERGGFDRHFMIKVS